MLSNSSDVYTCLLGQDFSHFLRVQIVHGKSSAPIGLVAAGEADNVVKWAT